MVFVAYPPHLAQMIAEAAAEAARDQLPNARLPELHERAAEIADALFDRLHTPDISIH